MKTKQLLLGLIALNVIGIGALVAYRLRPGDAKPSKAPQPAILENSVDTSALEAFAFPPRPEFEQPAAASPIQKEIFKLRKQAFSIAEVTNKRLPDSPGALCLLGKLHLRSNDLEGARALWERAIEIDPGYAEAYNDLGHLEEKQGNLPESIDFFDAAIERSPDLLDAYLPLVDALVREARFADAVVRLKAYLTQAPKSVEAWNKLGQAYQQSGEFEQASECFEQAWALDANSLEAAQGLMTAYRSLGNKSKSTETAKRLAEISESRPRAAEDRDVVARDREKMESLLVFTVQRSSELLAGSGDVKLALDQLNELLKQLPDERGIRTQLSDMYVALGQVDLALKVLREAVDKNPEDASAWMELALMCIKTRRLDAAENALQRLTKLVPDNDRVYSLLAQTQMPTGRDQAAAVEYARRAVEISPVAANHYILATAHYNRGDIENCRSELKIAIALEPENIEYRDALKRIQ